MSVWFCISGTYCRIARTRNRQDVVPLCQQPGKADLTWGRAVLFSDALDDLDDLNDLWEVLRRKTREPAPCVVFGQVLRRVLYIHCQRCRVSLERDPYELSVRSGGTHVFPSEEASSDRGVCNDLDPKLAGGLEQGVLLVLDVEGEGRVLHLQCGDWVDGVGAPESVC